MCFTSEKSAIINAMIYIWHATLASLFLLCRRHNYFRKIDIFNCTFRYAPLAEPFTSRNPSEQPLDEPNHITTRITIQLIHSYTRREEEDFTKVFQLSAARAPIEAQPIERLRVSWNCRILRFMLLSQQSRTKKHRGGFWECQYLSLSIYLQF